MTLHEAEAEAVAEAGCIKQTVRARLVTNPHSLHLQQLGELVQSSMEAVTELHQMLDVIHSWKVSGNKLEKLRLGFRQLPAGQQLQQVAEIVPAVERNPVNVLIQHHPGGHQELPESPGVDPPLVVLVEIDPALSEELDGVAGVHVLLHVELPEIELPDAASVIVGAACRQIALLVGEGEPELDQLEHVDVVL
ncbi:hypothetical protein V2J09_011046 [Rumex salicifolius]